MAETAELPSVVDATYEAVVPNDPKPDWYYVLIRDLKVGEVFLVKKGKVKGWHGICYNARKKQIGRTTKKEELGQQIVGLWEKFPHDG